MRRLPLIVFLAFSTPAMAQELKGFVSRDRLPDPSMPALLAGGETWKDSCQNCHGGNKLTGAPKITSLKAWAPRIDQGMDVLFDHAIKGFTGPKYTKMPARGGNADLSDEDVRAAVAFMVWASGGKAVAETWAQSAIQKME